tara:strand:+ start:2580 stop:4028 length:1449 start_codon:yes stop_codon:yes gene_type:complete
MTLPAALTDKRSRSLGSSDTTTLRAMTPLHDLNKDGLLDGTEDTLVCSPLETFDKVVGFVDQNCDKVKAQFPPSWGVRKTRGRPRSTSPRITEAEKEEKKARIAAYQADYRKKNADKIIGYRIKYAKEKEQQRHKATRPYKKKKLSIAPMAEKEPNDIARQYPAKKINYKKISYSPDDTTPSCGLDYLVTAASDMEYMEKYSIGPDDIFSKISNPINCKIDCSEILYGGDIELTQVIANSKGGYFFKVISGFVEQVYDSGTVDIQPLSSETDEYSKHLKNVPTEALRDTYVLNAHLSYTGDILDLRAVVHGSTGRKTYICRTEKYPAVSFEHDIKALENCTLQEEMRFGEMVLNKRCLTNIIQDMRMCLVGLHKGKDDEMVKYIKYEYLMFMDGNRHPTLMTSFTKLTIDMEKYFQKNNYSEFHQMMVDKRYTGKDYVRVTHRKTSQEYFVCHLWRRQFEEFLKDNEPNNNYYSNNNFRIDD